LADGVEKDRAGVLHEMPTIGDLDGVGRRPSRRQGVGTAAIACDDRDAGPLPQPRFRCRGFSVRRQCDRLAALKITNQRAVAKIASPGPIVDADHRWRSRLGRAATSDCAQQCVIADLDLDAPGQSGGGSAAERNGQTEYDFVEPAASASLRRKGPVQSLRECPSAARRGVAKEAPGADDELDASAADRQVIQLAYVSAMNPRAPRPAIRASAARRSRMRADDHADPVIFDAVNAHARRYESRKVEGKHGSAPNRERNRTEPGISPNASQTRVGDRGTAGRRRAPAGAVPRLAVAGP
jgi:hypothetical protein